MKELEKMPFNIIFYLSDGHYVAEAIDAREEVRGGKLSSIWGA